MRSLRFVSVTEDGTCLLEGLDGSDRFTLPVDDALRQAVRSDLPRFPMPAVPAAAAATTAAPLPQTPTAPTGDAPAATAIGPRDIQVRIRAGESPEELATSGGMSLDRVMRFAGPVVEERQRVAAEARRARARRTGSDTGIAEQKVVQFGEAVDDRFTAHGVEAGTVGWDSRRRDDGEWIVVARWLRDESSHEASWLFHRASRSVTPLDDTAADLLSDRPIRQVLPPEPSRASLLAMPALAPGIVAFPPMPEAHTGPLPVVEDVFDQEAPPEGPRILGPARSRAVTTPVPPADVPAAPALALPPPHVAPFPVAAADVAATAYPPALARPAAVAPLGGDAGDGALEGYEAPPLPLGIADPPPRPTKLRSAGRGVREESDEDRAARARVPSWDDILLGVRRKQD